MAHETRMKLIKLLSEGPMFSKDIRKALSSDHNQTHAHLSRLYRAGILDYKRVEQATKYWLADKTALKIVQMMEKRDDV